MPGNDSISLLEDLIMQIDAYGFDAHYSFQECALHLKTDNLAFIEFANTYFLGYFDSCTSVEPQITVYASSDTVLLERIRQEYPVNKHLLDKNGCGVLAQLNTYTDLVYRQDTDSLFAYYVVNKAERMITIVTPKKGRFFPMRAVRTLMNLLLLEKGTIPFHAACIVKDGYGVGITGNKFAGKTTTLINALHHCRCNFLANDKVLLHEVDDVLFMYGLPISLGIRLGTISHFHRLHPLLDKGPELHDDNRGLDEMALQDPQTRIYVSPHQLVSTLNCSIEPYAQLRCLVNPEYSAAVTESQLIPLPKHEAKIFLATQYLHEPFPINPYWKRLLTRELVDAETAAEKIVAKGLTVYKLLQNEHTNQTSAIILNRLLS